MFPGRGGGGAAECAHLHSTFPNILPPLKIASLSFFLRYSLLHLRLMVALEIVSSTPGYHFLERRFMSRLGSARPPDIGSSSSSSQVAEMIAFASSKGLLTGSWAGFEGVWGFRREFSGSRLLLCSGGRGSGKDHMVSLEIGISLPGHAVRRTGTHAPFS